MTGTGGGGRPDGPPDAGNSGKRLAQLAGPASPRRGRRAVYLTIGLALIAAIFASSSRLHLSGHRAANQDDTPVTNGTTRAAQPTVTPVLFNPADPFAGTPAAGYADGADGILIPAAHAVGGYSATQVRAAYREVRRILIAAHLNRSVLAGRSPTAFASLLIQEQRSWFDRNLDKQGIDRHGNARSSRTWLTSFAPGTTDLIGAVIKVHGRMTAAAQGSGNSRVLSIRADYLFVYPVQQAGGDASTRIRIVARTVLTVQFATWNDPGGPLQPWVSDVLGGPAGGICGINDGFVHPAFPGGPQSPVQPFGAPISPYDQSSPPSTHRGCQSITGT